MITHGRSGTKEHKAWMGMRERCYNTNSQRYLNYGGRGITVCARWRNSFEKFFLDMGECPEGLTLERRDINKGYNPKNCYWATWKEQNRNKTTSRHITWNGKTQIIADWANETGLSSSTIAKRIKRSWSIEKALTTKCPA
jgi:hypothetical protein